MKKEELLITLMAVIDVARKDTAVDAKPSVAVLNALVGAMLSNQEALLAIGILPIIEIMRENTKGVIASTTTELNDLKMPKEVVSPAKSEDDKFFDEHDLIG